MQADGENATQIASHLAAQPFGLSDKIQFTGTYECIIFLGGRTRKLLEVCLPRVDMDGAVYGIYLCNGSHGLKVKNLGCGGLWCVEVVGWFCKQCLVLCSRNEKERKPGPRDVSVLS